MEMPQSGNNVSTLFQVGALMLQLQVLFTCTQSSAWVGVPKVCMSSTFHDNWLRLDSSMK